MGEFSKRISNKFDENDLFSYTQQLLDNYPYAVLIFKVIKEHNHPLDFILIAKNSTVRKFERDFPFFQGYQKLSSIPENDNKKFTKFKDFLFDNEKLELVDYQKDAEIVKLKKCYLDKETIQINITTAEQDFPFRQLALLKHDILYQVEFQANNYKNWQYFGNIEELTHHTYDELLALPSGWFSLIKELPDILINPEQEVHGLEYQELQIKQQDKNYLWVAHNLKLENKGNKQILYGSITNIDHKKRNELYLNHLKTAFEQTSSSIIITDVKGRIQYVNKKFTESTGYLSSEILGKYPSILKSGYTSQQQYQMLWDVIRSGKIWRGQFLNKKKNGETYWEQAVIAPVFNEKSEIINYVAIKDDVTAYKLIEKDRQKVENALKANEEKFRSLFNIATDPIMISNMHGVLVQANDTACQLFAINKRSITELDQFLPDNQVKELLSFMNSGAVEKRFLQEYTLNKNGKEYIFEFNSSLMPLGSSKGILTIARDITDRKRAEKVIIENETKFRLLVENVKAIFWLLDLKSLQLMYISPVFKKLFGASAESKLQENVNYFLQLVHPDDLPMVTKNLKKSLRENIGQLQFRIVNAAGEEVWLQYKTYVITAPDNKLVQVGFCEDITESRSISEQLKYQNDELNKINKELDQFVYRVSHNLRAPLTSILGIANLLKTIKKENDKQEYLKLIETSIYKLDETIHEIIDYSKNSRVDIQYDIIDLHSLIEETLDSLRFMDEENSISVSTHLAIDKNIYSDANRIKVILTNLLSNAYKYADNSKQEKNIKINAILLENTLQLEVYDNGIGIRDSDVDKIFKMFYRGTEKSFGAGLGLAIVKEVVDKLGGTIELQSDVYQYSAFKVSFPVEINQ